MSEKRIPYDLRQESEPFLNALCESSLKRKDSEGFRRVASSVNTVSNVFVEGETKDSLVTERIKTLGLDLNPKYLTLETSCMVRSWLRINHDPTKISVVSYTRKDTTDIERIDKMLFELSDLVEKEFVLIRMLIGNKQ